MLRLRAERKVFAGQVFDWIFYKRKSSCLQKHYRTIVLKNQEEISGNNQYETKMGLTEENKNGRFTFDRYQYKCPRLKENAESRVRECTAYESRISNSSSEQI